MRASYSAMVDWFGTPKARLKWSTMVDTRGRHTLRLATKAGSAIPSAVRKHSPPGDTCGGLPLRVVRQIPVERGADRGPQLPVKRDERKRERGGMFFTSLSACFHFFSEKNILISFLSNIFLASISPN